MPPPPHCRSSQHPVDVRKAELVELHVWRCVEPARGARGGGRVWYEWALSSPVRTPILNPNGRSYAVSL